MGRGERCWCCQPAEPGSVEGKFFHTETEEKFGIPWRIYFYIHVQLSYGLWVAGRSDNFLKIVSFLDAYVEFGTGLENGAWAIAV